VPLSRSNNVRARGDEPAALMVGAAASLATLVFTHQSLGYWVEIPVPTHDLNFKSLGRKNAKVIFRLKSGNHHGGDGRLQRLPPQRLLYKLVDFLAVCCSVNVPADIAGERLHSEIAITLGLPS
jgi:hypothetical protein